MPLECAFKQRHGRQFCVTDCPASAPCGTFEYVRVERPEDVPAADPHAIDVAVLDMNHGWPNLGHDSLVHAIMDSSCETIGALEDAGLRVRVLSFDVRRSGVLPEGPGGRYSLYVGTGGPGHIDPRQNDGVAPFAQGVRENPAWEEPAFRLFDAIRASEEAALLADRSDIQEEVADPDKAGIQLMTIHAAKGLEFPVVVVVGHDGAAKSALVTEANMRPRNP